jgi:hypothetical protein
MAVAKDIDEKIIIQIKSLRFFGRLKKRRSHRKHQTENISHTEFHLRLQNHQRFWQPHSFKG